MRVKIGDRLVSRFGGHHIATEPETDNGWVKVRTPLGEPREWHVSELRPFVREIHGEWKGGSFTDGGSACVT